MTASKRTLAIGLLVCAIPLLGACNSTSGPLSTFGNGAAELALPDSVKPYPDGEVLAVAQLQFSEGNYGHAARYYERAVEVAPNDPEAWLGLAASYDRVRRFDLSDRAYREAARYIGNRAEYYNNVGYSYLLRGDMTKARSNFMRAHELAPSNLTINNNLELLRDGMRSSKRT